MKTNRRLSFLWNVLALCVFASYEYQSAPGRKKILKLDSPKSTADTIEATQRFRSGLPLQTAAKMDFDSVSVSCSMSDIVIRVKPHFYGLGADSDELVLGSSCKSNGVVAPHGELLFTYPLTECDVTREWIPGYLIYKFKLHYDPLPKRFFSRGHRIHVDITCRFPSNHHVHQLAVKPTWTTAALHKRLKEHLNDFRLELMDDSWSGPVQFHVYQLGQTVNFQASVPHIPTRGRLYVKSCYASPSDSPDSSLKYTIIDNFGCMLDSKNVPGASWFVSRTDNIVRFSVRAFQFVADPENEVGVHCKLFVTSEDPSPAQKSCTFRENRWTALSGDDSVCECCSSKCVTSKPRRAMMEGSASSGSLLISDQLNTVKIAVTADDLLKQEILWDGVKEEEEEQHEEDGVAPGLKPEPELDGFSFRDGLLEGLNEFREDGSGYEDDSAEGSEVKRMDHQNQDEGEGVTVLYSEGNGKHRREGVEKASDGDGGSNVGTADGEEVTWYFTWR
ncbi:zona pellucida protein C [Thalassophryne amazonica]|uniref:zona pellucida protein C n=1 Tax=Thalassophryne amazonica TaxID=390379 RepID=UPI001470F76A|nr:zona pellucida protein C [Thalassophryne amazonica]